MKIEAVTSAYPRLPLEGMGDAGHGAIDSMELITVKLRVAAAVAPSGLPIMSTSLRNLDVGGVVLRL